MTNKKRLKSTVKCFGYDKGFEDILIQGVSRLPDSIAIGLLENLDSFQASICNTFSEIDCLIAQVQARQEILNKTTEIDLNVLDPDNSSPQNIEETSCKPIQEDEVSIASSESERPLQTFSQIKYLLDFSSMGFVAMSAWMDIWSTYLRINSISEGINPKVTSGQLPAGSDTFNAAMNSMLNASTKAFDNMTSMAKQLSEIAEASQQAATRATAAAKRKTTPTAKKFK